MGGRCCCSDCKSTWDLGLARCCCCCIMCLLFRPGCSMLSRMASLTCDWWKITLLTQGSASAPSSSSGVLMALASARRERDTVTLSTSYVDMFLIAEEWLVLQKDSSFFQLLKKSYVAQRTGTVFGHSTQPFLSKPGKYIYLDYHSKKKLHISCPLCSILINIYFKHLLKPMHTCIYGRGSNPGEQWIHSQSGACLCWYIARLQCRACVMWIKHSAAFHKTVTISVICIVSVALFIIIVFNRYYFYGSIFRVGSIKYLTVSSVISDFFFWKSATIFCRTSMHFFFSSPVIISPDLYA